MKICVQEVRTMGLSATDVLGIIAGACFVAMVVLPILSRNHHNCGKMRCVNNLKQVGLSFRIWAGDNDDRYPMNISTNDVPLVNEDTPVFQYFQSLENELGIPKILVCPEDTRRTTAMNFTDLNDNNISYFVGLDASENLPQSILSGDRNIRNGTLPRKNILELTRNQKVEFTKEMHKKQGYIALGDGSVQQVSSARLRSEIISNLPFVTNRIKLP